VIEEVNMVYRRPESTDRTSLVFLPLQAMPFGTFKCTVCIFFIIYMLFVFFHVLYEYMTPINQVALLLSS